jgi:hypothetical protein
MANVVYKIFGGLPCHTEILRISGGFNKNNTHVENSMVIGNLTSDFIKNKIIEWESFKTIYYKNDKLDPKYYTKFLNTANNIFILPNFTSDDNDLLYMINTIYNSKSNEFINGLVNYINIFHTLKLAIKHLYMTYKIHIEKLIEKYVTIRDLCAIDVGIPPNNFNDMTSRWNLIDAENKIDTSSPILFFNFTPSTIKLEKTIPRITWSIKPKDKNYKQINMLVDEFLSDIKTSKFEYVGYCPNAIVHRFKLLLKFPIIKLIHMINAIYKVYDSIKLKPSSSSEKPIILDHSYLHINKKINNLYIKVDKIKNAIPTEISMKSKKTKLKSTKYNIKKFPTHIDISHKIKCFNEYIEVFIQTYKLLIPYVIKKENAINSLSIDINKIASDIENIMPAINSY